MLVLSRKALEKIHLGSQITITVLRVTGNVVRLGIEAPRGVRVLRGELVVRVSDEASAMPAADSTPADPEQAPPSLAPSEPPFPAKRDKTQAARRVAPRADSPRCRVRRDGFTSPGRHPLRGGPASVADGPVASAPS